MGLAQARSESYHFDMGIDRRVFDMLLDWVGSFGAVVEAMAIGESNLLFISDDFGALELLWRGLRSRARQMPVAGAFVDFGRAALSPTLLSGGIAHAVDEAFGGEQTREGEPPGWLTSPAAVRAKRADMALRAELSEVLDRFVSKSSDERRRPVLLMKDVCCLRALRNYKGVGDPFRGLGEALGNFPTIQLVVLQYGLSPAAVFETAHACLSRESTSAKVMPRLSADEASAIASHILADEPSDEASGALCSLCDGRLSYLMAFCGLLAARRVPLHEEQLVDAMVEALLDPVSALSAILRSRMRDAISSVRGDTVLRHILRVMSFATLRRLRSTSDSGMSASEVALRIGRSVPAASDYLRWLMRSLLLEKRGSRYVFGDRLLRLWVRLDTLGAGGTSGVKREFLRQMVREELLEHRREGEPPAVEAASGEPGPSKAEAEERLEVVKRRDEQFLEFD